jgi:methyltransferase (TIGR00027 family)
VTLSGSPSHTALTAAAARAAHLLVDGEPIIFADTLAEALLGDRAEELLAYHLTHGDHPVLSAARAQATCRSRYTEHHLAEAVRGGVGQYVILGAGLDTFAYRSDLVGPDSVGSDLVGSDSIGRLRVFEVDHPATQRWKRQQLSAAQIRVPDGVTFVPIDFEADSLTERLVLDGFDSSRPAVVSWLGVTMYLTRAAIAKTLAAVGRLAPGSELIVDYMLPEELRDGAGQTYVDLVMPVAAQGGEPWLTFLGPDDISVMLTNHGFEPIEQVGQRDILDARAWNRSDSLKPARLSQIARARVARARVGAGVDGNDRHRA